MVRIFFLLLLSCLSITTNAQQMADFPKGYFRNPLNIPISLAGNFGECRPNHFHSGLDIKTDGKENYPVYAAADGYISRIKMERGGFGHALYITHPNGYTTLYAHLNNFIPAIQQYMKDKQYEQESWEVDIYPEKDQFRVKKGQQIAWSGNTGGSTAPHLHFEIRDTKTEHPVNPQLFGFQINDEIAPKPTQIALYDLNNSIYEQQPKLVSLRGSGKTYIIPDTVGINTNLAGIGLNVYDYMNGSSNTLNFYTATVYMDDALQSEVMLQNIGYEETRYLHAYVDYKTRKNNGTWIQLLFRLPGNFLESIFPQLNNTKGGLPLADANAHNVRIELEDGEGNISTISFYIKSTGNGERMSCKSNLFTVNKDNAFENPNVKFTLGDKALYDNICFDFSKQTDISSYSDRYSIHRSNVPVHTYFDLYIKPNKPIPFELRDKVAMIYDDGKDESGSGATFDDGWYKIKTRQLGTYRLITDNTPPVLKALQADGANLSKASTIRFSAKDETTSVKKFRAELNGKWLCFEQKGSTYVYTFDEHCPRGTHDLVVTATDENNNTQTLRYTFTR